MARHRYYLLAFFAVLMTIFLWLCFQVYNKQAFSFDRQVFLLSHTFAGDAAKNLAIAVTFLGSQTFLLPANILLGLYFLFKHKRRAYAWKIAIVSLTSSGFLFLVKYLVKRPRPDTPLVHALNYSFPSGHTFTSITFFGMLVYFILTYTNNKAVKIVAVVFSAVMVLLVGWSRIYLYVHYASDVIAGFCLGIMWLILARLFLINERSSHVVDQPNLL